MYGHLKRIANFCFFFVSGNYVKHLAICLENPHRALCMTIVQFACSRLQKSGNTPE